MNTKRNNEITVVIAAITVTAALVSGLLTVRSANAAPGSKTTAAKKAAAKKANAKRTVKVTMSGSRRAAINRALALQHANTVAQQPTQSIPTTDPVEQYGEATRLPGNVPTTVTSGTGLQPLNSTPINNPLGTPLQPDPRSNNPIGATNVPGVVNNFGNPFALYGPPLINTGNGFAPVYGTGYNLNGYTAAPFNGGFSPYGNFSNTNGSANNPNYLNGATNFGY